jgi:N-carbamoylputrescine amidase
MTLKGAEVLLYPTAIGSEPANPSLDTKNRWQRAMIGHAECNVIPVVAANRIGTEGELDSYGHSFNSDPRGDIVTELKAGEEGFTEHQFDLEALSRQRASCGFFRDR